MTRHDPEQSMRDMLEYARKVVRFMDGKTRDDLDKDDMLALTVSRAVEIVGEAACRVSHEVRDQYPQLP